ncbi:hypothetical protein HPB49_020629 [Dermacentor silvarum]|uniref:Uncharacterized protein n=1 Tax=Dermacentor silvarum TaxID=543639 RepID=A0ACB8CMT8_DERSI|nr:hypothetical protein HPB49_020629 [Dermacentor silvarum]
MPSALDACFNISNRRPLASHPVIVSRLSNKSKRRVSVLYSLMLSLYLTTSPCIFAFVSGANSADVVPNLCRLMDQPLYCRCNVEDFADDATDVFCYVTRPITPDHAVFHSFQGHASVVSLAFNAFNLKHKLSFVPSGALRHCSRLERLKFTQSDLGALKTHSFYNLSRLAWLSLDSNAITILGEECIANLPRLKRLELGDNKLTAVPAGSFRSLPALTQVFLERNGIMNIEDCAFEELSNVRELDLSDNVIESLTEQTFKGLSRAIRLDLFRNKIKRLGARVFSAMPLLVEIDLKYNGVTEVDPLAFDGLPQLNIIYLTYNRLRTLPAQMFMGAPSVLSVDLSQNELITLTWRTVQDLRKIDTESFHMGLMGNKFICDCGLVWVQRLENATRNDKFRRDLRDITCCFDNRPATTSPSCGTKVVELSLTEMQCHEDYEPPELPSARRYDKDTKWTKSGSALEDADDSNAGSKIRRTHPVSEHHPEEGDDPMASVGKAVEVTNKDLKAALSNPMAAASEVVSRRSSPRNSAVAAFRCLLEDMVSRLFLCVIFTFMNRMF